MNAKPFRTGTPDILPQDIVSSIIDTLKVKFIDSTLLDRAGWFRSK